MKDTAFANYNSFLAHVSSHYVGTKSSFRRGIVLLTMLRE